jgi:hypothetical protein
MLPSAFSGVLEDQKTWILTDELMDKMFSDIATLQHAGHDKGHFFLFFEPPSLDARIFNQFAYFSVGTKPDLLMDSWLVKHPDLWFKIIIPKELKWEIRDKLDQKNMSERILFPGLGGLAQWLARYYLPTGSASNHP